MVAVKVEAAADVPVIDTEVGERLHEGNREVETLDGPVTAQVSVTVPVKELPGVTVINEVSWLALMLPPLLSVKLVLQSVHGGGAQKSPHPVTIPAISGEAASKIRPNIPIFIAAPQTLSSC
jgi:hypothetical protein